MRWPVLVASGALLATCSPSDGRAGPPTTPSGPPAPARAARIVIVGDVMLGRGVAAVASGDPGSVFELLRPTLVAADVAVGNLESPLTARPHETGPYALEADPSAARLLAGAGFDVLSVANNHAGDAGPGTVTDTLSALHAEGLAAVGAGTDAPAAWSPLVVDVDGLRIAFLGIDTTGGGPPAGAAPGVASWDAARAEAAVTQARAQADVVVVGLHGGVEYLPRPDPVLRQTVEDVTSWGADVVWASGAHVPYDAGVVNGGTDRPTVQAPGLGNALFDQRYPGTDEGMALEVLVGAQGVIAYRTGRVASRLRSELLGWDLPPGDAVAVAGEWWIPARSLAVADRVPAESVDGLFADATLVAAGTGDVTGDGSPDVVASYRRPARDRLLHRAFPDTDFVDAQGRTAHLAVFQGGRLVWGAGTLLAPVVDLAVCDGAVALGVSTLDELHGDVVGGAAWVWRGLGFATTPTLPGAAEPGCADVDGDGRTEPVLTGRPGPT